MTGCIGNGETPENGENGNTTGNGTDDEAGDGTDTDGGDGDNSDGEVENAGYTRFMYNPETAGVDAERYVFAYADSNISQTLSERIGVSGDAGTVARVDIRGESSSPENGGELPEQGGGDTVEIRVYEDQGSYGEFRSSLTEPVDSSAGYEIYESDGSVFGVNDDEATVVEGPSIDRVRLVVETLAGETPSYAESNEDIRVLIDAVGTGEAVLVRGGLPEVDTGVGEPLASAVTYSGDGEMVSLRYAVVYPDEESANAAVSTETLQEETPEPPEDGSPEEGEVPSEDMTPLLALGITELRARPEDIEVSNQRAVGRVAVLEASMNMNVGLGGL